MADCPSLSVCPFFNDKMQEKPGLTNMYKNRYCKGDNENCARWRVAVSVGKQHVPSDLYPNQFDRISDIIEKSSKNV
jgi:hypothetical protein